MGGKIRELQATKALQKCGTIAVQHVQDAGIIAGQGTIVIATSALALSTR